MIRQKGKSQNGCFKKMGLSAASLCKYVWPFSLYVSGGKKCSFLGKFGVLCFLETSVLRFVLLLYYQRIYSCWLWTDIWQLFSFSGVLTLLLQFNDLVVYNSFVLFQLDWFYHFCCIYFWSLILVLFWKICCNKLK